MEVTEFLRVVVLRKGKLKSTEFRLREGEQGLSLFAHQDQPGPADVIEAVRAAGKQGDLGAAILSAQAIRDLGLILVPTRGGTSSTEVNAIHYEAQLPLPRRLFLRLRGVQLHDDFNKRLSQKLCATARILE